MTFSKTTYTDGQAPKVGATWLNAIQDWLLAHATQHAPGGSDTIFPVNAAGHLKNNGSGTLSWDNAGGAGGIGGNTGATDNAILLADGAGGATIKTSSKTIVTTIGSDDTTVPTSKAVKDTLLDAFGVAGNSNTDRDANTTNHGLLLKAVAPASPLTSVVAIENGETTYKLKALYDTTHPENLGVAAEGSAATAARRDHVHSAELTLADGKSVELKKALGTDLTTSGHTITLTAHENVAFGNVCFINSDGEAAKADADAAATMPVALMATATINADAAGVFLLIGTARDDSWNWTPGAPIYASGTAGGLTATAPTGTGKCVQILGRALTADIILFNPDNTWLELS